MKRIGLLGGMSWESSAEYYRLVNEAVRDRLGGLHSADCVLRSVDFTAVEQRGGVVDVAVGGEHDRDRSRLLQRLRVGEPQRQPRRREVALGAPGHRGPGGRVVLPQLVRDHADQRRGGGAGAAAGHRAVKDADPRPPEPGGRLPSGGGDSRTTAGGQPP